MVKLVKHLPGGSRRIRLILWSILLLGVLVLAQSTTADHQARARRLSVGFSAPVAGADVSPLGINVTLEQYDDAELGAALARIDGGGFVWVRQVFYWHRIEPQPGRFDWTEPDRILAALARYPRLKLVAAFEDDPPIPPTDLDRFAGFARAFAGRYGAQVEHYQIWDEPNLAAHWGGGPVSPPAYADLLARTARAIRAADPDAYILLAGLAPTVETGPQNLSDVRYLAQLYHAGAAPYFDIACGKPYGFDTGPDDRRADEAVLNFSRLVLLREVMVAHGDTGKALWASHWGWNALPPGWAGAPSTWGQADETVQAARTVAALEWAWAEWPWAGALILENYQPAAAPDDPRWGFALVGQDSSPRPVYDAVAGWAAALPDAGRVGGHLAENPWVTYEGSWRVGPLGADIGSDGDRATFRFAGPSVALTVRRGPYHAFLYVTVDDLPAGALPRDGEGRAYLSLYDAEPAVVVVPLATGLSPGSHTVEVVAEGGQGQWALVDWRVGTAPAGDGFTVKIAGLAAAAVVLAVLLVRDARRMDWDSLRRWFLGWPEGAQVALAVGLTGIFWAAAAAGWGRDWTSPWFIISLPMASLLAVLFALRPDLGLALVAAAAPFYLQPDSMFYGALSLPEALVVLCGVGRIVVKPKASSLKRGWHASLEALDWAVVLLLLAVFLAAVFAADRLAAFFELRAVFLFPALCYGLFRLSRLDRQARWRVMDGFVLGGVGVAVVGLGLYAVGRGVVLAEEGLPRLQSVYPSPNNVGLYLGRAWPILAAVTLWGERGRRRALYGLALAPVTLALALSFSRGALLLALPAAVLVMGWWAGGRWRWVAVALVVIGALALIPLLRVPRFASLFDLEEGSTFFRLEVWRSSLALIRDHPWFGVGPGNFLAFYRTRYVLPSAWQEFNLEHPHSIYLDHWTRLGLLGVVAGIGVQVAFWQAARRRAAGRDALTLGLAGSMAALLVHGLVDNTVFFPDLALAFFLMLALVGASDPVDAPGRL